jgi:hypothetical protein
MHTEIGTTAVPISGMAEEISAATAALGETLEASDWNDQPMTPVDAIKQIAPAKGEAGNWIIWTGMTLAGLARAFLVGTGHLIARGAETRIRAAVVMVIFAAALILSFLAGHAGPPA